VVWDILHYFDIEYYRSPLQHQWGLLTTAYGVGLIYTRRQDPTGKYTSFTVGQFAAGLLSLAATRQEFMYGRQNARQHVHLEIQTHIVCMCRISIMCNYFTKAEQPQTVCTPAPHTFAVKTRSLRYRFLISPFIYCSANNFITTEIVISY